MSKKPFKTRWEKLNNSRLKMIQIRNALLSTSFTCQMKKPSKTCFPWQPKWSLSSSFLIYLDYLPLLPMIWTIFSMNYRLMSLRYTLNSSPESVKKTWLITKDQLIALKKSRLFRSQNNKPQHLNFNSFFAAFYLPPFDPYSSSYLFS